MTEQATANVVRHSVTVPISAERAFRLFTEEIGTWWPMGAARPLRDGLAAHAAVAVRAGPGPRTQVEVTFGPEAGTATG
jgi:hypothetical protein